MARKGRRIGECIYCGQVKPLSDDHVPPKCLFPEGQRENLITVPSCDDCNSERFSKDDEHFRLVLTSHEDADGSPEIYELWKKKGEPALAPGRKGAIGKLKSLHLSYLEIRTAEGEMVRRGGAAKVHAQRILGVVTRIAKGLFYHEQGRRVPDDFVVKTFELSTSMQQTPRFWTPDNPVRSAVLAQPLRTIGGDVFAYRYVTLEDDRDRSLWQLIFYRRFFFFSIVVPCSDLDTAPRGSR